MKEIAELLEGNSADLRTVIEQQILSLDRQAARAIELRDRLKSLLQRVNENIEPDMSDWLATLEMMAIYDRYFTGEELETLRLLRDKLKEDLVAEADSMVQAIRDLMARGVLAGSKEAQDLSRIWMAWAQKSMGGDPRLILKLSTMHRNEPTMQAQTGVDGAVIDYMMQAAAEFRLSLYAKYVGMEVAEQVRVWYGNKSGEWLVLCARIREQMERRASPRSPEVQALCRQWVAGMRKIWGDDPGIHEKLRQAHFSEPEILTGTGLSLDMMAYLEQGIQHLSAQS